MDVSLEIQRRIRFLNWYERQFGHRADLTNVDTYMMFLAFVAGMESNDGGIHSTSPPADA